MKPGQMEFDPLRQLLDLLERDGVSGEQLFSAASSDEAPGSVEDEFNAEHWLQFLSAAASLSRDPGFALRLGRAFDIASMGTLGFAIQSCADFRGVLKLALRYHTLLNLGAIWVLYPREDGVALRFNMKQGSSRQQRLMTEVVFAQFFSAARLLTGKPLVAAELHLEYPRPAYHAKYRRYLSAPLAFAQAHSQIILPEETLNLPVRTANPAGNIVFQQQCEEMLGDLNRIENTSAAVRRLLIQAAGDFPGIRQVAQKLHVSESTLRRRLDDECTSFRFICDEVKNVLAKSYLTDTELTVADIAHLLDYTDTANFRRAFIRWNGVAPGQFRQFSP